MKEKIIEKKLCEEVRRIKGIPFKFVSPGIIGVPDRIILLPKRKIYFIELKSEGKKLRPIQKKRKEQIENLGFKVLVIDSIEGVEKFLKEVRR